MRILALKTWDELPEPYMGSHKRAKAVVLNFNPGAAGLSENSKMRRRITDKESLIYCFENICQRSYRRYLQIVHPIKVRENSKWHDDGCAKWWNERKRWFRQFASYYGDENLTLESIFTLEISPFHSISWDTTIFKDDTSSILEHIKKRVLIPGLKAVLANNLPCMICIGLNIGAYLKKQFKWKCVYLLQNGDDNFGLHHESWPKVAGRNVNRTYEIILAELQSVGIMAPRRAKIPILVLGAPGSNKVPSENFKRIDQYIAERIKILNRHCCAIKTNPKKKGKAYDD